jgi:hypothetical protein
MKNSRLALILGLLFLQMLPSIPNVWVSVVVLFIGVIWIVIAISESLEEQNR